MLNRIRRLENTCVPGERERATVEAILAAGRRRLGADHEPIAFPPESYAGCRSIADRILRTRQLMREQDSNHPKRAIRARSGSQGADNGEQQALQSVADDTSAGSA
jgi:hypothetical protein